MKDSVCLYSVSLKQVLKGEGYSFSFLPKVSSFGPCHLERIKVIFIQKI